MAWPASSAIIIACALLIITPFVTYIIAVVGNHVDPFLPHTSTVGDTAPESTVFTQLTVLTTASVLLVIHIRFVYVALYCEGYDIGGAYPRLNDASRYVGYILCLGMLIASCFQESHAYYVHKIASIGLYAVGSIVYVTLQTVLSYRLMHLNRAVLATRLRIAINILMIISTTTLFSGIVLSNFEISSSSGGYDPEGDGLYYHLLAAVSDWIQLFLFVIYFLTFYREFKMVKLTTTKIQVNFHDDGVSPAIPT